MRRQLDVERAHGISARLEEELRREVRQLESITVHIEPCEVREARVVVPLAEDRGMASIPSEKFGRAPFFALATVDRDERRVRDLVILPNPEAVREARAGLHAVRALVQEKIDVLITPDIGEIAFHALRDHLVTVHVLRGRQLDEVLDNFLRDELEQILQPTKVDQDG
ncbi:MAG: Dinitrogenase iron-molybdenum cofactor [Methanomassiliicoccales archaeon PtaB.Bin215]|nr:MAG: Dinitrogenase iron-molybdenum cofactor [Methanomassiliicoccales archaeon PtaB.Bin215]